MEATLRVETTCTKIQGTELVHCVNTTIKHSAETPFIYLGDNQQVHRDISHPGVFFEFDNGRTVVDILFEFY